MKIIPGWLKQNIFLKKCLAKNPNKIFGFAFRIWL
jgi:hypothetical protein